MKYEYIDITVNIGTYECIINQKFIIAVSIVEMSQTISFASLIVINYSRVTYYMVFQKCFYITFNIRNQVVEKKLLLLAKGSFLPNKKGVFRHFK